PFTSVPFRLPKSRMVYRFSSDSSLQQIKQWRRDRAGSGFQRSLVASRPIDISAADSESVWPLSGPEIPTSLGRIVGAQFMACLVGRIFNTLGPSDARPFSKIIPPR